MSDTIIAITTITALGIIVAYAAVWRWIFSEQKRAVDEREMQDWQECETRIAARQSSYSAMIDQMRQALARRAALMDRRRASRRPFRRVR